MSTNNLLSKRGHVTLQVPSPLVKYSQRVMSDAYHETKNPKGFVDLGTAENKLMVEVIVPKLASLEDDPSEMYYANLKGLLSFRKVLKKFFEERFHPLQEIDPENMVVASGTTSVLETLAFAVCEHEDYMLVPTPYYYRIKNDLVERACVNIQPVPLLGKDEYGMEFYLCREKLERAYNQVINKGGRVGALLLINPHNPLGDVYEPQLLMDALNFAHKYGLHVIMDEIYALSVFDESTSFTSVLSLNVPDPLKTHFIWGFSKDLGLSGYRCGVLYSQNQQVLKYAVTVSIYHQTPAIVQRKLEQLVADSEWLDKVYFPTYLQRLRDTYRYAKQRLENMGLIVHESKASLFLWVNMSKFLLHQTFEAEEELQDRFIDDKVYILGGKSSYCAEPGWFRIVIGNQMPILKLGMDRIEAALEKFSREKLHNMETIRL